MRSYDKQLNSKTPIFLEMKGRVHDRIIKKRLLIDRNDLKYFEKLNNLEELYKKYNKNTLIKDFIYDVKKKKI